MAKPEIISKRKYEKEKPNLRYVIMESWDKGLTDWMKFENQLR